MKVTFGSITLMLILGVNHGFAQNDNSLSQNISIMEIIIFTILTILAALVIYWAVTKLVKIYYKIKVLLRPAEKMTDLTKIKHGLVYNNWEDVLETDQTIITPF